MTNDLNSCCGRRADVGAVAFAMGLPTLVTLLYFVLLADFSPGVQQAAYGATKTLQFGFPVVWFLAFQRRRLQWHLPHARGMGASLGFGLLIFAAIMMLYHLWLKPGGYLDAATVEVRGKVLGFGLDSPMKYAALGVFYSIVHSFMEEYYWRWFVFGQLRRLTAFWPAVVISSLGFMAHHVLVLATFFGLFSWATVFFSLCVAVGGAVWAWLYERSDSLYGPWLSHLLVDAAIFVVGYNMVADLFAG